MKQIAQIRGKVLKLLENLQIYVSCLPETEMEALTLMRDPAVRVAIADGVLRGLGADLPDPEVSPEYFNKTRRAVGRVGLRGEPRKRKYKKRDKEFWKQPKRAAKKAEAHHEPTREVSRERPEELIAEGFTRVTEQELSALLAPGVLPPIYKSVTEVTESGESLA